LVVLGMVQVPSGTRMKKTNGFSVRYQTGIMNADAGVSLLDADAQLCISHREI
jgi:hypothetical protein